MHNKPLFVLFITIFIDLLGYGIIFPILPIYADELGASPLTIGLIAASFPFCQFFFAPFWGKLSDHIGRRPVLLISIGVVAISYVVLAQASTIIALFIARMLTGAGSANTSTANAYVSDISSPDNRAKNYGIIGAAFGLGFIFGPPVGGIIHATYGIAYIGYGTAALAALNILMAYFLLPESLKKKSKTHFIFPNPFKELRQAFFRKDIRSLLFIHFVFMGSFSMMEVTATLMWENHFELNVKQIGYLFAFTGLSLAIIQGVFLSKFTKLWGEKNLFIIGNISMSVGLFMLPYIPIELFIPLELLGLILVAFGNAFFVPPLQSILSKTAKNDEQGKVMGLMQSMGSLSRIIGPTLGGAMYGLAYYAPFVMASIFMLVTTFMAIRIVKTKLHHIRA